MLDARPAPRPANIAGIPRTADILSSLTCLKLPISKSFGEKESVCTSISPPDTTKGLPLFSPPNLLPNTSAMFSASSPDIDRSFFGDITTPGTPIFFTRADAI